MGASIPKLTVDGKMTHASSPAGGLSTELSTGARVSKWIALGESSTSFRGNGALVLPKLTSWASASWRSSRESSPPGDARSLRGCRCRRRAWERVCLASRQYRRARFPRQIPNAARLGRRYRGTLGVLTPFATQRHSGNLWYSLGLEKYWSAARN